MTNEPRLPSSGERPWRVWATRPHDQNGEWQQILRDGGFDVLSVPLMMIEPVQDAESVRAVKNLIVDFDQFDKVMFVSQNAVRETFHWLHDYWPQLPVGIAYFAVGRKTAESVAAHGVSVAAGQQSMDTDELLALPQLQQVWGEKILICRGQGGLPRLGKALQERGAIVRYCELYVRRLPAEAPGQVADALAHANGRDLLPLFSGETLLNFVAAAADLGKTPANLPLVVPGKRVADMATERGFVDITTARNASVAAMLEALNHRARATQTPV